MKKLTKEDLTKKLYDASIKTGYVYTFIGNEKQTDKITVYCPKHNFTKHQIRQNATDGRLIQCCGQYCPMVVADWDSICKKFDGYSRLELVDGFDGYRTTVKIICPDHGVSVLKLTSLMAKKHPEACRECSHIKHNRNFAYPKEKWIEKAKETHGDIYDYSKIEDAGIFRTIICKKHGPFVQSIRNHVYFANGCPGCVVIPSVSLAEEELNTYFISLGFVENIDYFRSTRSIITPKELDFYFPNIKVGIEYNGTYWHSSAKKPTTYHQDKKIDGIEKNINIIMIYEYQWILRKSIILNRLKSILGKDTTIYARNTHIKEVSFDDTNNFCDTYHLQGKTISKYRYGLYYDDKLVALMTFGKDRFNNNKYEYELLRYVSNGTIVGGASKLFSHFIKTLKPKSIMSYADMDWSCGNLYEKLGFYKIGITKPGYVWTNNKECLTRYQTQIDNEDSVMKDKGYHKIYKSGSMIYLWEQSQ